MLLDTQSHAAPSAGTRGLPTHPLDLKELQFAERAKLLEVAARTKQEIEDFIDEQNALKINPDATSTAKGKIIRRGQLLRPAYDAAESTRKDGKLRSELLALGLTLQAVENFIQGAFALTATLSSSFGSKAANALPVQKGDYVYETVEVDHATHIKLMDEFRHVQDMETEHALWKKAQAAQGCNVDPRYIDMFDEQFMREMGIAEQANNVFNMRPHPVTGEYVHNLARVLEEEKRMAGLTTIDAPDTCRIYEVPVFHHLSMAFSRSGRGLKLDGVSDQYAADNVDGINGNENEAKAQPVPPPPPRAAPGLGGGP